MATNKRKNVFVEEDIPETNLEQEKETIDVKPANILNLPSNGAFGYPSEVYYRDIMVKDEEVLASATAETYAMTLNGVLKDLLLDCDFYEQLTLEDRDYILIWMWANNYSQYKEIEMDCPKCGKKSSHKIDMLKLECENPKQNIRSPMEMSVAKTGKSVWIRKNTVGDEIMVERFLKANKSKEEFSNLTFDKGMLYASIDIGTDMPFEMKIRWIRNNISGRELGNVRKYHFYFKYGIDTQVALKCPSCKEVTKGNIPFQIEDILYPTVSGDFEELLRSS